MGLVIALDPGKVTGVASLRTATRDVVSWEGTWQEAVGFVEEALATSKAAFVKDGCLYPDVEAVYETFTPRPGAYTWQPEALHCIGAVEYLAHKTGMKVAKQSPAQGKTFATNAKLKKVGWYHATPGGHANDALRHLLRYTVKRGLVEAEELLESKA
jgi:hypothetical protein